VLVCEPGRVDLPGRFELDRSEQLYTPTTTSHIVVPSIVRSYRPEPSRAPSCQTERQTERQPNVNNNNNNDTRRHSAAGGRASNLSFQHVLTPTTTIPHSSSRPHTPDSLYFIHGYVISLRYMFIVQFFRAHEYEC
jgi:hypothetical protein